MPTTKRTVIAKAVSGIRDERTAGGAISPGHLVQQDADGDITVHGTAGGTAQKMFAVEDSYQGRGISTAYASGEKCFVFLPGPGERVNAIAGGNVAVGDFLVSAGNGKLVALSAASAGVAEYANAVVAVCLEAAADTQLFLAEII